MPWLAVDVGSVVAPELEFGLPSRLEQLVEEALPCLGVHGGGVGDHAVHVEERGADRRVSVHEVLLSFDRLHRRRTSFSSSTATKTETPTPKHFTQVPGPSGSVPKSSFMKGA